MSPVEASRVSKYPTAIVAVLGGIALMSIATIAQGISFGFGNKTFISLMIPFVLGASITFVVSHLLQQRLDSLRKALKDQFDRHTRNLKRTEDRFHQYTETSAEWFWETDQDVTERKLVELEKQKNEDMLEVAIKNVPGGFLVVNDDGIIQRFNRQFFDMYPKQQFFINEGVPFELFVQHGIDMGVYQDALEDPEGWMQQRL